MVSSQVRPKTTSTAKVSRVFGIGCMPFEIPYSREDSEWPKLVSEALLAIPAVESVKVDAPNSSLHGRPATSEVVGELPHDNYRVDFWPEPDFTTTRVDISIPKRLHKELIRSHALPSEKFSMETHYGWHGPVTYVSLKSSGQVLPFQISSSVQLVAEFLNAELAKGESPVRMARVGPSPFHAQVLLYAGEAGKGNFTFEITERQGYETIEVQFDPDEYGDLDDAQQALFAAIDVQLQLFYELTRESNRRSLVADDISEAAAALTEHATAPGARAWFRRVFATGASARRLGLQALQARLVAADDLRRSEESVSECLAQSSAVPIFERHLNAARKDTTDHIIQGALDIVSLAESSRGRDFEVAVVAASTLLGAAAGAIAGLLVGGGAPPTP